MHWKQALEQKITEALSPTVIRIVDDSNAHAGHLEHAPSDLPTHLKLLVVSDNFKGIPLLARQRIMHKIMSEEMKTIHAISFKLHTPEEFEDKLTQFKQNNPSM